MRDPELVARAQHAAARLETAWERWRSLQGLANTPAQPVVGYVGYALKEPWGQPRAVIGFSADEAERLAEFLEHDNADGQPPPQSQAAAALQPVPQLSLSGPIPQRSSTGPMATLPSSGQQPTFTPQPSFTPQETQPPAVPPPAAQRQAAERQPAGRQSAAAPPPPQPRAGRPASSKHAQLKGRSARTQETETDNAGGGRSGQAADAAASSGVPAQAAPEMVSATGAADSVPLADLGAEGS